MQRHCAAFVCGLVVFGFLLVPGQAAEPVGDQTHTISGMVHEFGGRAAGVSVCLCDSKTGLPVAKDGFQPIEWRKWRPSSEQNDLAIVLSDAKGNFVFENVPEGKYRLIGQKWNAPFENVFAKHGSVIQLFGSEDDVVVPRPTDPRESWLGLRPPGEGIIQFDQEVDNDETFLFLSSSPPEFDPVLGLDCMGDSFFLNLLGVNRMPSGRTTVIGAPDQPLYAFFFAGDNSPGYAAVTVPASQGGLVRVPPEQFIAGWSNGRKDPPPKLAELTQFLESKSLTASGFLELPKLSHATFDEYFARMNELRQQFHREIELPEGRTTRVADLIAVMSYERLQRAAEKRRSRQR